MSFICFHASSTVTSSKQGQVLFSSFDFMHLLSQFAHSIFLHAIYGLLYFSFPLKLYVKYLSYVYAPAVIQTGTSETTAIWYIPVSFVITNLAFFIKSMYSNIDVCPVKSMKSTSSFIKEINCSFTVLSTFVPQTTNLIPVFLKILFPPSFAPVFLNFCGPFFRRPGSVVFLARRLVGWAGIWYNRTQRKQEARPSAPFSLRNTI